MALKDLLVLVDGSKRSGMRLELAASLAERHGASLTGLHVPDAFQPGADPGQALSRLELSHMPDDVREQATQLEDAFWQRVKRAGLEGEWRLACGPAAGAAAVQARYADLVILGQIDPEDPASHVAKGSVEQVLFSSGRPVLVFPCARQFDTVGQTVLIGWKASREAARAVNDAIPILEKAGSVTIVAANPGRGIGEGGDLPAADMGRHLARHGIEARTVHRTVEPGAEADALLDYAAELRADLLVVGGYGHLTQSIMGGVTRVLLQRTTVPVLLSH
jgi:nucleotide-binding universal stress UspA family protein